VTAVRVYLYSPFIAFAHILFMFDTQVVTHMLMHQTVQ